MAEVTVSEIIDDLRVAEEVLRKFERLYWITSEQFYDLYNQGVLDSLLCYLRKRNQNSISC